MTKKHNMRLGVNIDHVATVREARGVSYPDPVEAAMVAIKAGAEGITLHLREDRRHIQDHDVFRLKECLTVPMNLEMAATPAMIELAEKIKPEHCCLVPEKREELTTEGGLAVVAQQKQIQAACTRLAQAGVEVSLFIDAQVEQIDAACACGAPVIELHTGQYADESTDREQRACLDQIIAMATYADERGLIVNAGHGLTIENVQPIAAISVIQELNIGHSIVARAIFIGFSAAVQEMVQLMKTAHPHKTSKC